MKQAEAVVAVSAKSAASALTDVAGMVSSPDFSPPGPRSGAAVSFVVKVSQAGKSPQLPCGWARADYN
jgi:hypothetical protein